ncbi:MAG: hypothetical protein BWX70_03276 [Verrucomicrobia bacterium ADurb.Bin070]|nr:MAG: hypothetical protein BWX70_03276 [Verrucomicrobia bacterium ADurb.Bin070]
MSAPWSNGRTSPTPTVLSTISGMPVAWAIAASASKSGTSSFGLPMVSTYSARVRSVIAAWNAAGSREFTNRTVRPNLGSVWWKS